MNRDEQADQLAQTAERALLYEVTVNPKPGLVDPVSAGPHPDMNVFTFIDSATSLRPYFYQCAQVGLAVIEPVNWQAVFEQIRALGIIAEQTMFTATKQVNTHKGAVFSLGVLVTATAAQLAVGYKYSSEQVFAITKQMLAGLSKRDFDRLKQRNPQQLTAGERQFLKYGKLGIRGEAEAGFPTVATLALPFLRQQTGSVMDRLLNVLIKIAGETDDSNLIKRAGNPEITTWMHEQSEQFFQLGGAQAPAGRAALVKLNQAMFDQHLSLGGSADLLILTIFCGLQEGLFE
ncbi:triphosphoribosyl-dephospho-CoA synthase [Furfurilactobacillus sp. WILCCON 0119]